MKGHIIIPILSTLLVVSLQAQTAQVQSLERAKVTIAETDAAYHQNEAAVLGATQAPKLPAEPVFEVPSDQVVLDLPGADSAATAVTVDAETISVDFPEEDVRDIIRSVAELYELNVVIPDSLAGSVSIKLRDVTWQQVFNVVLEPLNFTYIVDGNIIKIKSRDELAVEPVDTRVFIVDFAKAGEISGSIDPLIDKAAGGKIQVDTRSNALVITERPSRMNDIQEIIETLDRPTEQVMIESKFVEISDRDSSKLGIDWKTLDSWEFGLGQHVDDREESGEITNYTDYTNLVSWDRAVFSAGVFNMVLSMLDTMSDLELISNPTVVTMNNTPARINIGEEYPIPSYNYNEEIGRMEINGFEYKPIGINLAVTPQINSAGFINLNILPEISTRTGSVKFGGASEVEIPIITTRKTQSSVTIKSGYTLAIGGLIEKRSEKGDSRVPVVGSIPVVGKLFSRKTDTSDKRNLIIFITAKILSASGATYEDVFSAKTLHEMGVNPRDVPGFQPSEQEDALYEEILKSRDEVQKLRDEFKLRDELQLLDSARMKGQTDLEVQAMPPEEKPLPRRKFN